MAPSVIEQIAALELERTRLEGHLAADENWRQLQALADLDAASLPDGADSEKRLRRKLAANPYYSARLKIVEAITILRRLGDSAAVSGANGHDIRNPSSDWNRRLSVPLFDDAQESRSDRRPAPLPSVEQIATKEEPSPATVPIATSELAIVAATEPSSADTVQLSQTAPPTVVETAAGKASLHAQPFAPAEAPAAPETAAAPTAPEVLDDLTRIRGLTAVDAAGLAGIGILSFEQIAAMNAEDVRRVGKQLGLGKRIAKSNWIEQAAILAKRSNDGDVVPPATGEPTVEPPSAASIAVASTAETPAAVEPLPAIVEQPDPAEPPLSEPQSMPALAAEGAAGIGVARGRYAPLAQLNEVQPAHAKAVVPQPATQPVQQVVPESPAEAPLRSSPRDWLAQRRRETAAAGAPAQPAPDLPTASPPPIPAAPHEVVPQPRISISTSDIEPPQNADLVIPAATSDPEGRNLLVASAGALKSLRSRLLGGSGSADSELVDPRSAYAIEEAQIEIVGGHPPTPRKALTYGDESAAEEHEQAAHEPAPSTIGGRLSQMFGALKRRG